MLADCGADVVKVEAVMSMAGDFREAMLAFPDKRLPKFSGS